MNKMNKIVVGLDFTEMDKLVLSYVKLINQKLRPDRIAFVNIHKQVDLPEEVLRDFPDLKQTISQGYVDRLIKQTEGVNIVGSELNYCATEGDPVKGIVSLVLKENYDLVVLGRKFSESESRGAVQKMMVRKSPVSVLLVSPNSPNTIKKILFPTDFSEHSVYSLQYALEIAEKTGAELELLHVVYVPLGFHATGKSFEEFSEIMVKHAEDASQKILRLCEEKGVKSSVAFVVKKDKSEAFYIKERAKQQGVDLVVVGARGRTNAAALFLGSVTESIIETDLDLPLLVVKDKEKTFDLWEVLKVI